MYLAVAMKIAIGVGDNKYQLFRAIFHKNTFIAYKEMTSLLQ